MSKPLQPRGLKGWNPYFPITYGGLCDPERLGGQGGPTEVGNDIALEHGAGPYTNVSGRVNDSERPFTLVYSPVEAEKQKRADEFGKRLSQARERAGLSLRELASEVGCSHAVLQKWESGGTVSLDYVILRRIAVRLSTTPERLMWGQSDDPWITSHLYFPSPRKRST